MLNCVNFNDPKVIKLAEGLGESPQVTATMIGVMQLQKGNMEWFPELIDLIVYRNKSNGVYLGRYELSTTGYKKGDPQRNPNIDYVFTENAEAYIFTNNIYMDNLVFPNPNNPKINVSDVNGTNQAGIRTDYKGNVSPNAYGIIVKKFQQDKNGRFVKEAGQFVDSNEDFALFKSLNEDMFDRLSESMNNKVIFPTQMGLGKAALPIRFAEWLKEQLMNKFNLIYQIEENNTSGYKGYGLRAVGIAPNNNQDAQPIPSTRPDRTYEVSTAGDSRFSALNAKFKPGTTIDGVNVSNMTIEDVYQNIIKKSGKGKAPSKDSKIHISPENYGTTFKGFPEGVIDVLFTLEDVIPMVTFKFPDGEIGRISYRYKWEIYRLRNQPEGGKAFDREELSDEESKKILNQYMPKDILDYVDSGKLNDDTVQSSDPNDNLINTFFRDKFNIHFINEYIPENSKNLTFEDFSYYEGYLPLWQEWAKQNPELIEELRRQSKGKKLTDKFAKTRVNQARALTLILGNDQPVQGENTPKGFTFYSGGAVGSDQLFANVSKSTGNNMVEYTANDYDKLSEDEKNEIEEQYQRAVKALNRKPLSKDSYGGKLVRRDMMQANSATQIIAIAESIDTNGYPNGGTGYASARGFERGVPVHIYNQSTKSWFTMTKDGTVESQLPSIMDGAALIGTRKIDDNGISEINSLFDINQSVQESIDKDKPYLHKSAYQINEISKQSQILKQLALNMSPMEIKNRVGLIALLFSNYLDNLVDERIELLEQDLQDAVDSLDTIGEELISKRIDNTDRDSLLKELGPLFIFDMIKEDVFGSVMLMSYEEYADIYLDENFDFYEESGMTQEEVMEDVKKESAAMKDKYQRVYENFDALIVLSGPTIQESEHVKINFINGEITRETDQSIIDADGMEIENDDDMSHKEESGIGVKSAEARSVSMFDSLSQNVKALIRTIPETNTKGEVQVDDMNIPKNLDPTFVYAVIMKELASMTTYKDFMPLMRKLEAKYSWIKELNDRLDEDSATKAQFYKNFRSDHISYSGMTFKRNSDGSMNVETYDINKSQPGAMLLTWKSNIMSGLQITPKMSLYKRDGTIDPSSINDILLTLDTLASTVKGVSKDDMAQYLQEHPKIIRNMVAMLGSIGIDVSFEDLSGILNKPASQVVNGFVVFNAPFQDLLKNIRVIVNGSKKLDYDKEIDIISEFSRAYRSISETLADINKDSLESSFREAGKTRYAHSVPCYLLKTIKNLSDSMNDEAKFNEFVQSQFGDVSFFKSPDGEYLNQWLKELVEDKDCRDQLRHEVLLTVDKTEYATWSPNTYYTAIINMYFSEQTLNGGKYGKYYVPIMSDAQSAEFIRFKRYTGGIDEFGNKTSFKDQMKPMYRNLLYQELNRMVTVVKRANAIAKGENIKPIANYDIKAKAGLTYTVNDTRFSFLTRLNGKTMKDGTSIQQGLLNMIINKDPQLEATMDKMIESIMNEGFQDFIADMNKYDVLNQAKNGKLLNFTFMNKTNYQDMMEEYYWNSSLATALIVQLTTTDFAFYKNPEDFQKRFKEIHSPTKKLYIDAEFVYKVEGKEDEIIKSSNDKYTTVLLADDEDFVSTAFDNIKSSLQERVNKGFMTKMDMDSILNKFKGINVADALAYRSLESFRDVYIMGGMWTTEMETAFRNLKDGKWDMNDFYVLWQPIKPFVFTLNVVDSKVGNNIKVPVQYKNSEYLLLALFNSVAGPTGLSPKLRAINQFMVDNNIGVVQFESTTKAGKHGVVNINDVNEYDDVIDALNRQVKIDGQLNDLVVQSSDYEDYGIQVETPEHMIDHSGLRGTQITKLIMSDLGDVSFSIGGNKYSKGELITKYSEILSATAMNDFLDVDKMMRDPLRLSQLLAEEVSGSARHGNNMLRSVLLNEKGEFTIPLNEKSHSIRIQNTLNAIFKSRVTKQKIAGGALIQATAYGLTDDLNIIFKDSTGKEYEPKHVWLKNNPGKTEADYQEYAKDATSIAYIESYMPWYTAEYFAPLLKEGSHELDPSKIKDKSLLDVIGYRI